MHLTKAEIMVVDDTPEHIELLASILHDENFKVRIATNGHTALELLKQHHPDLILLDVYMPEMDGFELCKNIKNNPALGHIPIIFITASNDEESIKKGFELKAQDYVVKPFNVSELLARIHTHLKLKFQTQALQEAYQELDQFCHSVSHDLKAPLQTIGKLIEHFISDYGDNLDNEKNELIDHISKKSTEVVNMIDRLLEFSRMSKIEMNKEKVDLTQVFHKIYQELIRLQPNRNVVFHVKPLPIIDGDPILLRLLILNILSNALKFTCYQEVGKVEVSCSEETSAYIIATKDNGKGFDMTYVNQLFDVFQRLHSQEEFEGSGVGLSIIQRIVKRHGGKAWITGKINEGATLFFSIPKNNP
ncbi:response regulator [Clostridium formicaceticum]|nr:response regulator [Clostridium formicaceticum]ARE86831.1 Phytochrome-like protein cph1 [Clostridium formicaceticum]